MNDTAVKLTSAEFDPSSKGRYHLSIGLADRSVSFALLDVASKNYVAYFGSTAFDPHALGDTFRTAVGSFLLGVEPISVSAFVKGGSATLVPSGSFDESQAHHHLALTQSSKLNTGVLHETIPALDVEMLYAQDPELSNALFKQFPQCKTLDARTVFLRPNLVF